MELKKMSLSQLHPYENNPRINWSAVGPVTESIEQVGYISPIVVDEDGVILAGHTRYEALTNMGVKDAEVIVMSGMTEEQKKKFRILDNKTSELADWDEELLKGELENLDLGGIHWFDDIMNKNVAELGQTKTDKQAKDETEDDGSVVCPRCGAVVIGGYDEEEVPEWN